jgi:hypothetical protein
VNSDDDVRAALRDLHAIVTRIHVVLVILLLVAGAHLGLLTAILRKAALPACVPTGQGSDGPADFDRRRPGLRDAATWPRWQRPHQRRRPVDRLPRTEPAPAWGFIYVGNEPAHTAAQPTL